jgi:hypothetical protein
MRLIDLTDRQFGRWTVIARGPRQGNALTWFCRCECGTEKFVEGASLRRSDTPKSSKSCGCYRRERITRHGQSIRRKRNASAYGIWSAMKDRCSNPSNSEYAAYGGRGIKVCSRWIASYQAFISDMGPRPSRRHSIDRINNDGNYEPGNCRWATRKQQDDNRRNAIMVVYGGKLMRLREVVSKSGSAIPFATIRYRVKHGWPIERALTEPQLGNYALDLACR